MFVDEWGSWYRNEPGHPGYGLYQQNSLRDALLAGITLHILQDHNDRVRMANIAQVVNVLQSMILTRGDKMLLTPTYHLFEMYMVHRDASRLPVKLESPDYEFDRRSMPALSIGASRDGEGVVHVSVVNVHAKESVRLVCELPGFTASTVTGRVLTSGKLDAHNTFEEPQSIKPTTFDDASLESGKLAAKIPPRSIVALRLAK